jgi:hypothetical protein
MCLVDVVVGVLADDDGFDALEGRVTGPAVDIFAGWEDLLAGEDFAFEELLEFDEGGFD